jgi:hypothetical protein
MPSGVQQAMNSHLQSNGATQAAKVDNLMPSAIFHSFLSCFLLSCFLMLSYVLLS